MQPVDFRRQLVLITGASSGFGVHFAQQFAARGADLILVARREERLRELADRLETGCGITAHVVPMDLGRIDAGTALREELERRGLQPTSLVNNAGFASNGPFHELDQERLRREITLDVAALTDITRTYLAELRATPGNFLINIASIAGYQPTPRLAVYSACKAYVLSLTESLWYESRGTGLRVLALCPGPARTEFFDVAGPAAGGDLPTMDPEDVVAAALRRLDQKDPSPAIVPGPINKLVTRAGRFVSRRGVVTITGLITDRAHRRLD